MTLKLVGTRSNRSAIGARVRCSCRDRALEDEVRGGGSYISQNDLRVHFGLGSHDAGGRACSCAGRAGCDERGATSRPTSS